ncbi:MAG: glycosyltransferase family 2 protein [Chloroflexi bacterium]|nr:glycosyltransferase family 2 protein [Chloroflexota bacterium]
MSSLVTVAIPVYNGSHYIAQTIGSAQAQSYPDVEIIVIDDGSTDDTAAVVQACGGDVQYVYQKNQGVSAARNHALHLSQGKYIVFLDADDLWKPGYLDRLVSLLERHPAAAAAYCGYQYIDPQNNLLFQHSTQVVDPAAFYSTIVAGNFIAIDSVLIRKSVLERIGGFNSQFHGTEDTDLLLRLPSQGPVIGISDILVLVRVDPHSLSSISSNPSHMAQDNLRLFQHHFGSPSGDPYLWTSLKRDAYRGYYFWTGVRFLQVNQSQMAAQYIEQAFLTDPQICSRLDTFYELSLAGQPRGTRGDYRTIDLTKSSDTLLTILNRIFHSPVIAPSLSSRETVAYANAYWALGLLAYGQRDLPLCRKHLAQAARLNLRLLLRPALTTTLLKTFLGSTLLNKVTRWRRSFSSHAYTRSF